MDGNIRGIIAAITATEIEPDKMTLRNAVDWYKKVAKGVPAGTSNFAEISYVNERWAWIVSELAKVQGVPASYLSYMLNELAQGELRAEETA